MLALSARSELDVTALEHLEHRLLNALVPGVGGDRVIGAGLARDLIKLVEINDAVLGFLDILAGGVIQVANSDLDIGADEARLRQARRVGNREWNVEQLRQME